MWKGTCMESHDSISFKCNKKLVGARFYSDSDEKGIRPSGSARDQNGHGTHVASTAAGSPISGACHYGLASGIAKGGSPGSKIAMYRVCTSDGCRGSAIMKAFDDAIADGVDVLSLSLGSSSGLELEFSSDPIAIGSFHAVEKGILVSCSAGNDGPDAGTVVNVAPWILTVAATTIDRDFETDIVLGGNKLIKGKLQFASKYAIHQLHIFIFVLAVAHVLYCITTLGIGKLRMRTWRAWEDESKTIEYQFYNDPERFRFARDTSFGRRHLHFWSNSPILLWIVCFFRQFYASVEKVDYLTLRHGFAMNVSVVAVI